MGRLEERVIIVTGGAHGLGRAYCEGLAREGARVVVADIDGRGAETVAETLSAGGQEDSCWARRAKIKTGGINWELVERTFATTGAVLAVKIEGRAKDGGPCCATVPLIDGGWKVRTRSRPAR